MIITTGVAGPSGRQAERVCKGSAPSGHCPMSMLLVGVPYKCPCPRPFGLRAAPALDGADMAGARQHYQPTGSAARAPHALRVCRAHCDRYRCGRSQDPGIIMDLRRQWV